MSKDILITFPDKKSRNFPFEITGLEIAKNISTSLGKKAVLIKINDEVKDLSYKITKDSEIEIVTIDKNSDELLDVIRHSTAHLLAQALKELYPHCQITIGPVIDDGFYYDISYEKTIGTDDLILIERKMNEIAKRSLEIKRDIWSKEKAINYFKSINEFYKVNIINDVIPEGEELSIYQQGDFLDLCRGPHLPNTNFIKHFKLTKVSGAYWRGDSKNEMLQRIYGTAWLTQEDLDLYIKRLEEAEKRDHRRLGVEMDLFHTSENAVGSIFWHPKGWTIYKIIRNYISQKLEENEYCEVKTPIMMNKELWEKSGHWEKYQENMFIIEDEKHTFAMKPMNCPAHVEVFKKKIRSYRDLPLRMAEFGCCHRNESSGSLHGLMRVREFVQDDAHIFCRKSQILQETKSFCQLVIEVYKQFGFENIDVFLSTRPDKRIGSDALWDTAEKELGDAVLQAGMEFKINEGDGAFYGPKLDFQLTDALGRKWQTGTLQLDMNLPERLNATFTNEHGDKEHPIMLHRAILGSFERFIGVLIEHYAGKLPVWLAPVQVAICPISEDFIDYAESIYQKMKSNNIRVILDKDNETVNYKIREHMLQKIPHVIIIGKKEMESGLLAVRKLDSDKIENVSFDELIKSIV